MNLLREALADDQWLQDLTSRFCLDEFKVDPAQRLKFKVVARQPGCFSGSGILRELKELEEGKFLVQESLHEGEKFSAGQNIFVAEGPLGLVLSVERSLLNLLQHSCSISTTTRQLVDVVEEEARNKKILAPRVFHTRKTLPGLRDFQIEAVVAGGGACHRRDLSSGYLFKENHKYLVQRFGADTSAFLKGIQARLPIDRVQVEVESEDEYRMLVATGLRRVLLDNFSPARVTALLADKPSGLEVEVSGNISPTNIRDYVLPGVDRISLGFLTHSVRALDLGLDWEL